MYVGYWNVPVIITVIVIVIVFVAMSLINKRLKAIFPLAIWLIQGLESWKLIIITLL